MDPSQRLSGWIRLTGDGCQAADGLAQITFAQVVLFEAGSGATPWEITKLLLVTVLPYSLVGPFAGVLIDRYDRRLVMVVASFVRAALVAARTGYLGSNWLVYPVHLVPSCQRNPWGSGCQPLPISPMGVSLRPVLLV